MKICSDEEKRDIRMKELKEMLLEREYDESVVDTAITRAKKIERHKHRAV